MAGNAQENQWKDELQRKFPQFFSGSGSRVLDIGSADINGTNRDWFDKCDYIGIDIMPWKNVSVVSIAHEYEAEPASFDVVCSTSELEHDIYWHKTLKKMERLLKPGGLMWFTAGHNMAEHGTRNHNPNDSLTSSLWESSWSNYYGNITEEMVRSAIDLDFVFEKYEIKYASEPNQPDLFIYFWGIKKKEVPWNS